MKYFVIDPSSSIAKDTRAEAENLKSDLLRDNPTPDWQVVVQVEFDEQNPIEQLYTLAANLLQASRANPLDIGLEIYAVDGSTSFTSALEIMNAARKWIDAT